MGEWRACRGLGTAHGSTAKGRAKYHTLEVPVGPSLPVAQSSLVKVLGHSFWYSHPLQIASRPSIGVGQH